MAEPIVTLSQRDLALLKRLLRRVETSTASTPQGPRSPASVESVLNDPNAAAEVYIAKAPSGGIPRARQLGTGGDPPLDLTGALCQVYHLNTDDGYLVAVDGLTPRVYNISTQDIPEGSWVIVKKEKYGEWVVDGGSAESRPGDQSGAGNCQFAKLSPEDCIVVHTYNEEEGEVDYYLTYDPFTGCWTSTDLFLYPGGSGFFKFCLMDDRFILYLDDKPLLNCGDGCYSGGWVTGHGPPQTGTGTPDSLPCNGPSFTVCVECACCPIDGWAGDGWYCVSLDTGTDMASCFTVRFLEGDECSSPYTICTGPYATEAEAEAVCGADTGTGTGTGTGGDPTGSLSCCAGQSYANLTATFSGGIGSTVLIWDGSYWSGLMSLTGCIVYFRYSEACGLEYRCDDSSDPHIWLGAAPAPGYALSCGPPFSDGPYRVRSILLPVECLCAFGNITVTLSHT